MLKQRIITGVALVFFVVLGVLTLPSTAFAIASAIVILGVGGWEWAKLTGLNDPTRQLLFIISLVLFALAIYLSLKSFWPVLAVLGLLTWAAILYFLYNYTQGTLVYQNNKWLLRVAAFPVLLIAWSALLVLQAENAQMLLYLILLIAVADSSAYFAGRRFGKNKLAPELSPGKTLEGMMGAMLGAAIWSLLAAFYFNLVWVDWAFFILLSIVTATLSIAGDLFESLIKREAGQKDSGKILPGHGGILDRIDSLLAALPFFTAGVWLFGGILK